MQCNKWVRTCLLRLHSCIMLAGMAASVSTRGLAGEHNSLLMLGTDMVQHASLGHPSAGSSKILSASSSPAPSAGCRGMVSIATSPSDGSAATDPDTAAALLAAGVSAGADSLLLEAVQCDAAPDRQLPQAAGWFCKGHQRRA